MSLTQRALHLAYLAGMRPSYRQLVAGARDVRAAQDERLRRILAQHAGSAYGRAHGLPQLLAAPTAAARREGLRARAPLVTYDDLAPWVARVAAGEGDVLSCGPLKMLERSGGSTATNKLIPYNEDLLAEFRAATNAWLYDLYRRRPALWGTKSYWSVSPAAQAREVTAGGLPIGVEDDTEYFSPLLRWALSRLMAAPGSLARAPDFESWRRATLRCLLEAEDLGLISVWNPTFLTLLMDHLVAHFDELAREVSPRRQRALARAAAGGGGFSARRVWPRLGLISCWADGAAAGFVPALQERFPGVEVQPKGVLATEGALTAPLTGVGAALCVTSHFYEFLPVGADGQLAAGEAAFADELEVGGEYSVVMTTGGGLWRYHIQDVVRCEGRWGQAPLLRFMGKLDGVSDLCGEKVSARQVEAGLAAARAAVGARWSFALLAPELSPRPRYVLYLESEEGAEALRGVGAALEEHLATGHHYSYCRRLGQLGPLEVRRVRDGAARAQAARLGWGQRLGDIKPALLDRRAGVWGAALGASELLEEAT